MPPQKKLFSQKKFLNFCQKKEQKMFSSEIIFCLFSQKRAQSASGVLPLATKRKGRKTTNRGQRPKPSRPQKSVFSFEKTQQRKRRRGKFGVFASVAGHTPNFEMTKAAGKPPLTPQRPHFQEAI
jgi:hypothetical protein